jgi:hypothetical protein
VYPAPAVTALITQQFVTLRAHVKENPSAWKRFGVRWSPTVLILAPDGTEVRRIEGFLPEDEFLGQLNLALGYLAANHKDWKTAQRWFQEASRFENTDAGPEGLYWEGVARYSATHDHTILGEITRAFRRRYPDTSWAKRASIWAA